MEINSELLEKYYQNQCNDAERKAVEVWLADDTFDDVTLDLPVEEKTAHEEQMWAHISKSIDKPHTKNKSTKITHKTQHQSRSLLPQLVAASVAILLICVGTLWFTSQNNNEVDQLVMAEKESNSVRYETKVGQHKSIILSDGTMVHLNASTTLETDKEYVGNTRMVKLTGEAYFEVAKDSLRPFTILTEQSKTTVLGTKFNLSAYPQEKTMLTLNEGKVSFKMRSDESKELILLPKDQAIIADGRMKKNRVNPKFYNAWKSSNLFFDDDLSQVFKVIERRYGIQINVEDEAILRKNYRGYHKKPSLDELIKEIGFVMKYKVKREGKTITILN